MIAMTTSNSINVNAARTPELDLADGPAEGIIDLIFITHFITDSHFHAPVQPGIHITILNPGSGRNSCVKENSRNRTPICSKSGQARTGRLGDSRRHYPRQLFFH
jgi:hypothetical protein